MSRTVLTPLLSLLGLALLLSLGTYFQQPGLAWARTSSQTTPTITLLPTTALPNQPIAVTGTDFTTGGKATVSSISIGGVAVGEGMINFGKPVSIGNGGNFVTTVIIPVNATTINASSLTVAVTDGEGVAASATLTISTPTLTVAPASSRVGGQLTVTGANFPIDNSSVGADDVPDITLEYETTSGVFQRMATVFPNSTGGFTASFAVPSNAVAPSKENILRATMSDLATAVTVTHSVLAPTITLTPAQGPPGTTVTMKGIDFEAFAPVGPLLVGNLGVDVPPSLYTDGNGGLSTTFVVPEMDSGAQSLLLTVRGLQYTGTFTIQSSLTTPDAVDYVPPPLKFEVTRALTPLEENLIRVFHFDNRTKQWSFYDPQPEMQFFNTLTEIEENQVYWIGVREDQALLVQGSFRPMFAGWNLIVW